MSLDLIVIPFFLIGALGPIIHAVRMHRRRQLIREDRNRLAHTVLRHVKTPLVKNKRMGPDKTWIEMRDEVRRRRRSIPRASTHVYQFKFQVGKQ